jgi:hypothetical protein
MKSDLWTLQFFISEDGVCEVKADFHDHSVMECTCLGMELSAKNASTFALSVKPSSPDNDGYFSIKLDAHAEDTLDEGDGPDEFRKMLLKYATVEVLP